MSDYEDKKNNLEYKVPETDDKNQSEIDSNNQPESEVDQKKMSENDQDNESQPITDTNNQSFSKQNYENQSTNTNDEVKNQNIEKKEAIETLNETKSLNNETSHQVIHKKEDRLHIYVRQDKYKGELKSKNWVGRLYIDGKQKISSSGTTNLDEAIPILEKWFDDIHEESQKLKNKENINENVNQERTETSLTENSETIQTSNENQQQTETSVLNEEKKVSNLEQTKGKLSNFFGKIKEIKIKKPDFAKNLSKPSLNKSKIGIASSKFVVPDEEIFCFPSI